MTDDLQANTRQLHSNEELALKLFSRGEAFDAEGFAEFFTDTPLYQFGNMDLCLDKAAITASAAAFFSGIVAVYHDIKQLHAANDQVLVEMDVHYWRHDGSRVALPCCDIFRVQGGRFAELRIFMDANPVFEPARPVSKSTSVFTGATGPLARQDWMRWFFAAHPEGRARVAAGHPPRWSGAGPHWHVDAVTGDGV